MRRMGRKTKIENCSAQQDSKFSKLRNRPFSPSCLFSPLASKNTPVKSMGKANADSGLDLPIVIFALF